MHWIFNIIDFQKKTLKLTMGKSKFEKVFKIQTLKPDIKQKLKLKFYF